MNLIQNSRDTQTLNYSNSSSCVQNQANFERLSDSLQYLDRMRSINKKVFDSNPVNQGSLISPLEKLVHTDRQITYIDNQKLYGIIKIQSFTNLKNRIQQLEQQQETYKINENQMSIKVTYLEREIIGLRQKQSQINHATNQITRALNKEKNLRIAAEQKTLKITKSLFEMNAQKTHGELKYLALLTDYASLNAKIQKHPNTPSSHQTMFQAQTEFYKPTIQIPSFSPNLEVILKKIREKQGEKVSRHTLKEIVARSLDNFVKELDAQYKIIHEQTIDLNKIREYNQGLMEENNNLKHKIQQLNVEEQKLKIFRNCMTSFLDETSQNVSKSIESQRIRKRIYEILTEDQRNLLAQTLTEVEIINEEANQNPETSQLKIMEQNIQYLKKENIQLLKTIGDYHYKIKKVEKVLDQSRREEILDEGTVGQLVKMSKLVKQSIKSLLQEL